jgi:hypothetical protein
MYEVGLGWVVSPFVDQYTVAVPKTLPGEGTAEGTDFQTVEGSALLFVFDPKKKKVNFEGGEIPKPLIPRIP